MTHTCDPALPHPNYDDIERVVDAFIAEPTLANGLAVLIEAVNAWPHTSEDGRIWIAEGARFVVQCGPADVTAQLCGTPEFIRFAVTYRRLFDGGKRDATA